MARSNIYFIYLSAILLLAAASCSNTKHLPEGESLFTGGRVILKDNEGSKRERHVLREDLEGAIRPKPNTKFLGMRLKLSAYYMAGDSTKKGFFRKFLRNIGEPPVLASQFDTTKNRELFVNVMENRGFFYPRVDISTKTKNKKTSATFDVWTGPQYTIRNVQYVKDSSDISDDVAAQAEETLLKKDAPFNLDLIKGERDRVDKKLKEIGYYYFQPDYLIVQADTTIGDHKVDMYVKVKDETPAKAREKYYINRVFIYPNYRLPGQGRRGTTLEVDSSRAERRRARRTRQNDTLFYERYYIIGNTKAYKPYVFTQAMQFYPGDPYNRTDQNMALNRLINIGTFKFVKNDFLPFEDNLLDVQYQLTPLPKKALRAELGGHTKNDSRVGSEISISWRNRNALRGAELFAIKGSAGFEAQSGGNVKRPNIYQFNIEPSMTVPRFVVPFIEPKSSSFYVPHTIIKIGYDMQLRTGLYALNSFNAAYGYQWKENIKSEHELYPINITYVSTDTLNKDSTFFIDYSNLIFNGLIIGPTYNYTYNTRVTGSPNLNDFYFNGLIDMSGNILGLIQGSSKGEKTIFGQGYAEYIKAQTDFRHYYNYNANPASIIANRIIIGVGYPHGNSSMLPNVKQFFSGGNSSLRGFPSRLVGPGTFHQDPDSIKFIETSGDIKLELNTEFRMQLHKFLHGALFVDAGNVWTYNKNPLFPGGQFSFKSFLNELAVNTGIGARLDFQILVLRLDVGIPIRKPWLANPWDFSFNVGDSDWRRENLILNIGIGYPF